MIAIDRLIFGSGHGLAMPYWNQRLYWMVDAKTKRGTIYTWCGGFGAQLHSIQWTHPRAQEERVLAGVTFKPFSSHRSWGRVMVAWAMVRPPRDAEALRALEARLGRDEPYSPLPTTGEPNGR